MKAIVYTEYGAPDVLHLAEVETPAPQGSEILIRVSAASVGFGDLMARNFGNISAGAFNMPAILYFPARVAFGWRKPKKPILGSEFAGTVAAVGAAVTRFKPGDAVFGYRGPNMGAYAEYLSMPEDGIVALKPVNLSDAQAAAGTQLRFIELLGGPEFVAKYLRDEQGEPTTDITLEELRAGLAEIGLTVSVAGLHRFFVRRGMTRKKRLLMQSSKTGPTF